MSGWESRNLGFDLLIIEVLRGIDLRNSEHEVKSCDIFTRKREEALPEPDKGSQIELSRAAGIKIITLALKYFKHILSFPLILLRDLSKLYILGRVRMPG